MKNLIEFSFEKAAVRVEIINDEPWFVAKDVCKILNLSNSRMALKALDDDEKGVSLTYTATEQRLSIISESGLYTLVLRCRNAVKSGTTPYRFRKWVTNEVLPSIRKSGAYIGASNQIESAYKLAAHVASVAAHTVFQAVLSGENKHDRWMFHMNWNKEDPVPWAAPIGHDEMVVSVSELPHRLLESNGTYASNAELLAIASACHHRLTQRLGRPQ